METVSEKGQPPVVILKSIDKQLIGAVAAKSDPLENQNHIKEKVLNMKENILEEKQVKQLQVKI